MVTYERLYSTVVKSFVLEQTACVYILALPFTSYATLEIPNTVSSSVQWGYFTGQ